MDIIYCNFSPNFLIMNSRLTERCYHLLEVKLHLNSLFFYLLIDKSTIYRTKSYSHSKFLALCFSFLIIIGLSKNMYCYWLLLYKYINILGVLWMKFKNIY